MAANFKTLKAGALAAPAFLMAGCENPPPEKVQHALWFLGHVEILLPLLALILIPSAYWLAKKTGLPRGIPALWIYSGIAFAAFGLYVILNLTNSEISPISSSNAVQSIFLRWLIVPVLSFALGATVFKFLPKIIRAMYNVWLALLNWAFWSVGMTLMLLPEFYLFFLIAPQRYVDNQAQYKFLDALTLTGAILCMIALATFVVLLIEALVVRRPMPHKAADPKLKAFE